MSPGTEITASTALHAYAPQNISCCAPPNAELIPSKPSCARASAGYSVHSSNAMMMSAPSPICACHRAFRTEEVRRAIEMRAKRHAFLGDFAKFVQTENLETAGVGQDRPRPRHKPVQPAKLAHGFNSRTQDKGDTCCPEESAPRVLREFPAARLSPWHRAHRHEHRSFDLPMRRGKSPGASAPAGSLDAKLNGH